MKGKKVVITGGAGFIGSNLADELARDNEVVIIDDLSTGRLENISHLLRNTGAGTAPGNVTHLRGSVTDLTLLRQASTKADFVFHLAAIASVPKSVEDPVTAHEVNLGGTLNVLLAARDTGVTKVVLASSCALYGNDPALPKVEDMPLLPESPYAVTKLAGEYYCRVFSQVYGLPTVCLRYFNVYGPRQDPHSEYAAVIPRFITRALQGQALTIFGDGSQTRDFVYVKDAVRANILAAESDQQGIYNIGTGEQVSINMLAVAVKTLLGTDVPTVYQEARSGEVKHSRADISRAAAIRYSPRYTLEAGLKETVAWLATHDA